MLDVAKKLKDRKARRVIVCTTFGLFTDGLEKFDEYYEKEYIYRVITTNLTVPESGAFNTAILSGSRYEQISGQHHGYPEPRPFCGKGKKHNSEDQSAAEKMLVKYPRCLHQASSDASIGVFDPRGSRQMDMRHVRLACCPRE